MLAEWVLLGNLRDTGLSLEASCARRGVKGKEARTAQLIKNGVSSENVPRDWLEEYCHDDVEATHALFKKQLELLTERNQLHLVYQRGLVCACLTDIEFAGLKLDADLVREKYNLTKAEYNSTLTELSEFGAVNWRSGPQVRQLLYTDLGFALPKDSRGFPITTPKGEPSVSAGAIDALKATNDKQRRFVELYRRAANLNAQLTKNLEFFNGVCEDYGGIFYGSINQGRTGTHRLSSSGRPVLLRIQTESGIQEKFSGIQLQNIQRDYKGLFKAKREDWLEFEVDFAQLEFRGAADLCHDDVAEDEIKRKVDIHSFTAKALTDAGEPTDRQAAKSRTFRPLFGGSSGTPAEKEYCKFFRNKYKQIHEEQTKWTYQVLKTGELVTPYGMRFYWPGTRINPRSGYIDNTTAICNYPIQGFSTAEIVPLALICFWHRTKNLMLELVNTIHDSIVAEVHPEHAEKATEIAVQCLTKDVYDLLNKLYNYRFHINLGCEIKIGSHWGKGESSKFESTP